MTNALLDLLGIHYPIIQAPMVGVSSPAMAAAVSNAGALGSVGLGIASVDDARCMISSIRERTDRPFNMNVFCHAEPVVDNEVERRWIQKLRPQFERFGAVPPESLRSPFKSFLHNDDMLQLLISEKPAVVSFHFGMPSADRIQALSSAGITLLCSATSLAEARVAVDAGVHAIVAQGYEAGGHRGMFDPDADDARLGTLALTRLLVTNIDAPIIAAGGIMDGAGIAAVLRLGASAAQLGTAFIASAESLADSAYREALASEAAHNSVMTRGISGRLARCLPNRLTALVNSATPDEIPAYPIAYHAGKALISAAASAGHRGFDLQFVGQGAPLARALPAAELVARLVNEM